MKIVVTHPVGNRNVRAVISSFEESGILARFCTTLAFDADSFLLKLLPAGLRKELIRRTYPVSPELMHTRPMLEFARNFLPKFGYKKAVAHETGFASIDKVCADLDNGAAEYLIRSGKKEGIDAIYAYEDCAEYSFTTAKELGIECVYDLPIGYWRTASRILKVEQELWPEWASTLTGLKNSEGKLFRKDEELRLADRIFVASTFTAQTLKDYPGKLAPVAVIPYGFPPVVKERRYLSTKNRPLKLLFVGGLSQRKGIANLFAAVKNIGDQVELTVVGRKTTAECRALDDALKIHNWIPSLPHNEVLELMQTHDVLVFPSLFEGFGLVITEAMSQGTPVITTDRTAGPDLITHGENGWIVEAGSTAALQQQIELLLANSGSIELAGKQAMETAKKRPWEKYGQELSDAIKKIY